MPSTPTISIAQTDELKLAVYRFRYDVYVEELGRYRTVADHDRRLLMEPEDEYSTIFCAELDGEVVGTSRLTWGGEAKFPARQVEHYGLEPFLAELPPEAIAVGERGMIAARLRGTDLLMDMMRTARKFATDRRIQLVFGACEPHLLSVYLGLGHRTYSRHNINSPESGYLIPIVTVVEDVEHLRRLDSPILDFARDFGDDARVPEVIERVFDDGSAVTSSRLTGLGSYWGEIDRALGTVGAQRVSALDGLSEEEAEAFLAKSNIIECGAGDRVLKKGGTARNIFVVLDGTLEVRDGDAVIAVLSAGDVFGEMAFLLERPRTKDVFAATDGVRVLSLSETTIRKLIDSDSRIAATLLLNISKMLCLRLIKQS